MANIKNFSDFGGKTVELVGIINGMDDAKFASAFPNVKGRRYDGFSMKVGRTEGGEVLPVTRSINYGGKNGTAPSRHECDARCMGATGRTMNCECACGGKNHGGRGFSATPAF